VSVRRLVVERASDGTAVWAVDVADSWVSRLIGLMGRKSIADGSGLFFPGTNGIHMLFMRFAIDCVFVSSPEPDGTRVVVSVKRDLRPWTSIVWFVRRARGAIELRAGSAAQAGIDVGERLRLVGADL
jgi:uncharacterized membrane protein (UPF0127 family)